MTYFLGNSILTIEGPTYLPTWAYFLGNSILTIEGTTYLPTYLPTCLLAWPILYTIAFRPLKLELCAYFLICYGQFLPK